MLLKTYQKTTKPKGEDGKTGKCPLHSLGVGDVAEAVAWDLLGGGDCGFWDSARGMGGMSWLE